jgi:hypothetical protein
MQGYQVILSSQIDGEFEGFDDEVLFPINGWNVLGPG